jgi:hypothetical protein
MNANRTARMLSAALAAAGRGWHVFPLRPNTKWPALHGYRNCRRVGQCREGHQGWEQRATADLPRVHAAWSGPFAGCNVGIATGPSRLVVIDLDVPAPGEEGVESGLDRGEGVRDGLDMFAVVCEQAGEPIPWDTYTVATPRGGAHLYFTGPADVELRNTEGEQGLGLGWHIDTRAHGGYVIAAGSTRPDGTYRVAADTSVAALPAWMCRRLTPKPPQSHTAGNAAGRVAAASVTRDRLPAYVDAAVTGECDRVRAAQPHQHTRTLFSAAGNLGQLVGAGALPPVTAETALYAAAQHLITGRCHCTDAEVRRTITNGLRAGSARPRTLPTSTHPANPATGLFTQPSKRGAA